MKDVDDATATGRLPFISSNSAWPQQKLLAALNENQSAVCCPRATDTSMSWGISLIDVCKLLCCQKW